MDFSTTGRDFFFQCGPDRLSGSSQVLPLSLRVADENMNVDITLRNNASTDVDKAFFLQGVPKTTRIDAGGTGLTPIPQPGIYYSWPQLLVSGTVTLKGEAYRITAGSGWIDHQLLMTSLENPGGAAMPIPFVQDPRPFNGWTWQFYNLDNGQAFTGAAFVTGEMDHHPAMHYGYFLAPKDRGWAAVFINGNNDLLWNTAFPVFAGEPPQPGTNVDIPIVRTYRDIENAFLGHPLCGVATPWYPDGTFNNPNGGLCGEFPADYTDLTGNYANGVGYLETVGFEPVATFRAIALAYLRNPMGRAPIGAAPQTPRASAPASP